MTRQFLLAFAIFFFTSAFVFAQNGNIRGTVYDQTNGEALFGVTTVVKGTTNGVVTDFDGKFDLVLAPGSYDLEFSFVSFEKITITGVEVVSGQVTVLEQIWMSESVETLEAVVITAEVIRNSESALMTVKRKSAGLMDGISASSFKKIGDSDAAGAVKRVTGVSVEGGKYVYVRGLGDRYTKTTLNNVDIPGLDPDRNSLQMDIFPTSLIDNMMVNKSFQAEMPADFTGGIINIETKDFPDERLFSISAGVEFNPRMHFNSDYITYDGSSTDWLGYDDGQRALPARALEEPIPSPISGHPEGEVNEFLRGYNPVLGAKNETSFMDYSFGVSYADQKPVGSNKLGYIFSLSYKSTTQFYDDQSYGEYQLNSDRSVTDLTYATTKNGALSHHNVLIGGLAGVAYKTQQSKFKFNIMHLQNGESSAAQMYIDNNSDAIGQSGYLAGSNNLEYTQRALTNLILTGSHTTANGSWNLDWRISPTFSKIEEPDIRKTAFTYLNDTIFSAGAGGNPKRIWRSLDEVNLVNKIDITKEYQLLNADAKFKFGGAYIYKERDYRILGFDTQFFGLQPEHNGDPNNVLSEDNLYPNGSVYFSSGNPDPNPNEFNSSSVTSAAYISNEFSPIENLKTIVGLRAENYVLRHTGRDIAYSNSDGVNGNSLDNDKVLDSFDLFPSVNVIYALTELQNLRASFSRTIARPSFKEMSFAQIIDPISDRIFNGGLFQYPGWEGNLHETRINNFDLRWELFLQGSEMFSVSTFYKTFDDPIELVRIPTANTTTEYQPRNVGQGTVLGAEFEFRKSIGFIIPALENFSFNGNLTLVKSTLEMTNTEFNARENQARDGQTIDRKRQMAGQAPYIINAGLSYENFDIGLDAGFFYNVKGRTLTVVGGNIFPDVYAQPFHSLNFNLNKNLGPEGRSTINFSVNNILNQTRRVEFEGYEAGNQTFERYTPGVSVSVGYKFSF